jgi:hypothetical protein
MGHTAEKPMPLVRRLRTPHLALRTPPVAEGPTGHIWLPCHGPAQDRRTRIGFTAVAVAQSRPKNSDGITLQHIRTDHRKVLGIKI